MQVNAASVNVGFTELTGSVGGNGYFKADLTKPPLALNQLASITLTDTGGSAGSPGVWSGFDLDGIRLSTTDCAVAACVNGASNAAAFDFVNALFTAGTLDSVTLPSPLDGPCLAGTTGCNFDNSKATLGAFDALYASVPGSGFLSMGRGGVLRLNLLSILNLGGPLFLYVGEAGNNGETLLGVLQVSDTPAVVPVPAAIWLFGSALVGFFGISRRRRLS